MLDLQNAITNETLVPVALVFGAVSTAVLITLWLSKRFNTIETSIARVDDRIQELDRARLTLWTRQDQRVRELEWIGANPSLKSPPDNGAL